MKKMMFAVLFIFLFQPGVTLSQFFPFQNSGLPVHRWKAGPES